MSDETDNLKPESSEPEQATPIAPPVDGPVADPIGDETDGEAAAATASEATPEDGEDEAEAAAADTFEEAVDGVEDEDDDESDDADEDDEDDGDEEEDEDSEEETADAEDDADADPDFVPKPRPPAKLERLQKILAQAGVASRRHAEEMIEQGRIQVNGTVVTELGTKADAGRDHIRVDGKLLQGAERLRYFVLNKPRGFVTTVKDPEHRPTVMQFFEKMNERLYPVGRLDYMTEGLLLVTNDGDLANRLTKAASGVEKTYLVKVSGQPTEAELDIIRNGVEIERGKPGQGRVRTAPARVRQIRQGDNPWYEVVLIEGRNRELRKMFEEIGHFVEKIRRVGYGPLILDQEPGNLRELDAQELVALRKVAEGKLRTPKSKEVRRRNAADASLPKQAGKSVRYDKDSSNRAPSRSKSAKPFTERSEAGTPSKEYRPKKSFDSGKSFGADRPSRSARPSGEGYRPATGRPARSDDRPRPAGSGPARFGSSRPAEGASRPAWKKDAGPSRPPSRFGAGASGEDRPSAGRTFGNRPAAGRTYGAKSGPRSGARPGGDRGGPTDRPSRPFGDKPAGRSYGPKPGSDRPEKKAWSKPGASDRPAYKRPAPARHDEDDFEDLGPRKPSQLFIEPITQSERPAPSRPASGRPSSGRPSSGRPSYDRAGSDRPNYDRPRSDRPSSGRSGTGRPSSSRPSYDRPTSGGSGSGRPSTGRPSYDRPSGPGRTGSGPSGSSRREGGLARPFTTSSGVPRAGGARPSSKPGKSYGAGSRSKPGGSSRPGGGFKGRPSSGGKRSGGAPGGRKRS